MSSTTDRYRRRHGDTAYADLAARASLAGLESMATDLMSTSGSPWTLRLVTPVRPVRPGPRTTPGPIAGRDLAGRALPLRDAFHVTTPTTPTTPH